MDIKHISLEFVQSRTWLYGVELSEPFGSLMEIENLVCAITFSSFKVEQGIKKVKKSHLPFWLVRKSGLYNME
jgi:hypothetical protein